MKNRYTDALPAPALHTPGPWHSSQNNTEVQALIFKDGIALAQAFSRETGMSAKANADLLAAAPELAEALYLVGLRSDYEAAGEPQSYFCLCGLESRIRKGKHTTICDMATAALVKAGLLLSPQGRK